MRFFRSSTACIVTLLLMACSTTQTLVALLPEESGTSGAISVGEGARAVVLDVPLTRATVDTGGNIDTAAVTREAVPGTFGEASAAQPRTPLSSTRYLGP